MAKAETIQKNFICIPEDLKKAEILLVYPDFAKNELGTASYPENQLGLNRLASYLDFKGHTVKVLNTTGRREGHSGPEELAAFLAKNMETFEIVGFHVNSWNISHIIKILEINKEALKNRLVLFGGPLPTAAPEQLIEMLKNLGFNNLGLVQGYGELVLEQIILKRDRLSEVEGVWSWQHNVMTKGSLQRLSDEQMAALPFLNPKYNTFYQQYFKPYVEGAQGADFSLDTIFFAQGLDCNHGCPFNCSYCSVHIFGHKINEYTPQRVCDELEYLARETGFFMFTFTNSNLMFLRREWILDFCNELIKRGMHSYLSWSGYHHPNTINLLTVDDFKLLKKAGCDQIVVGIQSVEPKILEIFNRHKSTYQLFKEIRRKTAEADLELVIDYIRGVPGEDIDLVEDFYNYCIENKVEMREFLLKIYPNTEITAKNLDFSDYEIIPITGNLARELDSFAVVPKFNDPRNQELSRKILISNNRIKRERKIRLGQYYLGDALQARKLMNETIPAHPQIPDKVKFAMVKMLMGMLNPVNEGKMMTGQSPEQMMKSLILAGEDAPPLVKKLQEKLRSELGEEKFQYLRKKYGGL